MTQAAIVTQQPIAQPPSLIAKMASRYSVDAGKMLATLKATAFKGDVSNEQMMALLIVADQYGLNPWTKEVYAFPDKNNGIVPVVGVDGWARIINNHPQFDGMEFEQDPESCTCTIYRKDRAHPVVVTEYMSECKRGTGPWGSHPRRMLRHKAMIQCARLAFGYAGIYDPDEADRIIERDITPAQEDPLPIASRTEAVKERLKGRKVKAEGPAPEPEASTAMTYAQVVQAINAAADTDTLDLAGDLITGVEDAGQREELATLYRDKRAVMADELAM